MATVKEMYRQRYTGVEEVKEVVAIVVGNVSVNEAELHKTVRVKQIIIKA